ncbi:hypothetical protein K502DRAFT_351904 [Neoconidiobolus thromboides FSU 785]|nr:hypothetical protein K502DRAFT_351904 [Neoconidiobolus thromboides FSU 785]
MNSPYNQLPLSNLTQNGHILIVGLPKSNKTKLAKLLIKNTPSNFSLAIRLCESLIENEQSRTIRPKIDLIIYILDLQQLRSFTHLKTVLAQLHPMYPFGKFIILCNNYSKVLKHSIDLVELERYLQNYFELMTIYTDLDDAESSLLVAKKVFNLLCSITQNSLGSLLLTRCLNSKIN